MLHTHKPQTEAATRAMQTRNAHRLAIAKRVLGKNYICHPAKHVKSVRQKEVQSVSREQAFDMMTAYFTRAQRFNDMLFTRKPHFYGFMPGV